MPLISMLVASGQRVKAGSVYTPVAAKRVTEANPDVAVLMQTVHGHENLFQALLGGGEGYVLDG